MLSTRRMLQLLPTLGAVLLLQAPTRTACLVNREGGETAPSHVVEEAQSLHARYRHVLAHGHTQRRWSRRKRDLKESSFSTLEEHLFQPIPPQPDNEQLLDDDDSTSLRQVGLEGSAPPLFFCSKCSTATQHQQEECARCKGAVEAQQQQIRARVQELFPEAKIVATTQKLVNMVFVETVIGPHDDLAAMDRSLSGIEGVLKIVPQEDSHLQDFSAVAYLGGGAPLEERFCGVGGKGVKVAILDSGVDYTHARVGGPGTPEAYELAYGTDGPESPENKVVNPTIFPTATVVGGKDFLGESFVHTAQSLADDAIPDDNPIDANRHGTMVADAILSVAPQTQLLACKVCTSDTGTCPGFAVLQALEYSLDPNGDGSTDDKVDIVNLSLGGSYLSSYYDLRTQAMERVFQLGVLPVVAAGNEGNIPFIGGPGAKTPNAVSVAATNHWGKTGILSVRAGYTSRGPGDENALKPDISAPSGLTLAAYGTGNGIYRGIQGTSFAAPVVAGALALVKERCPDCSPFALKAILMNNAQRHVQYNTPEQSTTDPVDDAPNSLVGAGELRLEKALDAGIWAYCEEDTQASVSFGLINADKDTTITKTIKVINLSGTRQTLRIRNQFSIKKLGEQQENPLVVSFSPEEQVLPAGCNTEVTFEATLLVQASKAPLNRMTSGGAASNDPATMDWNEFGGWFVIEDINSSNNKDISLPYHAIVRQASDVRVVGGSRIIENFVGGPTKANVGLTNHGAGVAQVDAFELLFTSEDDAEGGYGEKITPSDFRYIGYRVVQPEGQAGTCDYLLEFAFTTWEKQQRLNLEFFQVHFDVADADGNFDNNVDYILFNSGVFTPFTDHIGCVVRDKNTNAIKCTGYPPDHGTNTGNTVLRVCSNDIGFPTAPSGQQKVKVYILTATATHLGVTEVTDRASQQFHTIEFPQAWISAPSYDIYPGATLEEIEIDGTGGDGTSKPLGLMLVTNSYRGANNTGAASTDSETVILTNGQQTLPTEVTPDDLAFPIAEALQGPECAAWSDVTCATARSGGNDRAGYSAFGGTNERNAIGRIYSMRKEESSAMAVDEFEPERQTSGAFHSVMQSAQTDGASTCPETTVPRSTALRIGASQTTPVPTSDPTPSPTNLSAQTLAPTMLPAPANNQTNPPTLPQNSTVQPTATPYVNSTGGPRVNQTSAPPTQLSPLVNSTVGAQANQSIPQQTPYPSTVPQGPNQVSPQQTPVPNATPPPSQQGLPSGSTTQALPVPLAAPVPTNSTPITSPPPFSTSAPTTATQQSLNASQQTPAPTPPLRIGPRPSGPITAAIDFTDRFETPASAVFGTISGGASHSSTLFVLLGATLSLLALALW